MEAAPRRLRGSRAMVTWIKDLFTSRGDVPRSDILILSIYIYMYGIYLYVVSIIIYSKYSVYI